MKTNRLTLIILLVGAFVASAIAQVTDRPPSWAVGVFSGYSEWRRGDVEVRLESDGSGVFLTRKSGAPLDTLRAFYRRDALEVGSARYYIYQDGNGLRLENRQNNRDVIRLRRGSMGPVSDRPNRPDQTTDRNIFGTFTGRNDDRRVDVELTLKGDEATIVHKSFNNSQSWNGKRYGNEIEFGWVRYRIEGGGDSITLRNVKNSRESFNLRRFGNGNPGPLPDRFNLNVEYPRNNFRTSDRNIEFRGTSNAPEVRVEIFRGRDRIRTGTSRVNRDRFSVRMNLEPGRYDAVISGMRDNRSVSERRMSFEIANDNQGSRGSLTVDNPRPNGSYRPGNIEFNGYSGGDKVRIEIFRDRSSDRIYTGQVGLNRDGRWSARVNLPEGRYNVQIVTIENGRAAAERKFNIDVQR